MFTQTWASSLKRFLLIVITAQCAQLGFSCFGWFWSREKVRPPDKPPLGPQWANEINTPKNSPEWHIKKSGVAHKKSGVAHKSFRFSSIFCRICRDRRLRAF